LLSRGSVSSVGWTSTSLSWSVTKPGIGIVVVVECVAAIFALVDVCSSIGVAFIVGDLLRSRVGDDSLGVRRRSRVSIAVKGVGQVGTRDRLLNERA
jgi:hypothetical protein